MDNEAIIQKYLNGESIASILREHPEYNRR